MMKYILWYTCLKINNDTVKATLCGGRILKMGTTPRPSLHSFLTDSYGWRPTNREKRVWWQSARGDRNVQLQATRRLGEFVVQTYFKIQYVFRYTFSQLFMEIICLLARELSFYFSLSCLLLLLLLCWMVVGMSANGEGKATFLSLHMLVGGWAIYSIHSQVVRYSILYPSTWTWVDFWKRRIKSNICQTSKFITR